MQSQGGGAPASPASGQAGLSPSDPIGAALGGELSPGTGPITSGLSVGPGPGSSSGSPENFALKEKLLAVAESAKSPALRTYARLALRSLTQDGS